MSHGDAETPPILYPDPTTARGAKDQESSPRVNDETVRNLRKTVDQTQVNVSCVYMTVLLSFIFIVVLLLVYDSHRLYAVGLTLRSALEEKDWGTKSDHSFDTLTNIDDVDSYMRHIFIPTLGPQKIFLDYDYTIGIRMNLKRAFQVNNTLDDYEDEFPYVWDRTDMRYDQKNEGELTDRLGVWDYSEDDCFAKAGAYTQMLMLVDMPEYLEDLITFQWRQMRAFWLTKETVSIVIEILIQNSNLKATTYYYQVFEMSPAGKVSTQSQLMGTFPELFSTQSTLTDWVFFLGAVLLLECLVRIYSAVMLIIRCVSVAIKENRNDMEYYELLGLLALIFEIWSISLFGATLLRYADDLQLPITDSADFSALVDEVVTFREFVRVSTVAIIFIVLRAILILKNEFPSFGILFDTIIAARNGLIYFGFMAFTLLFSFSIASYQLFGLTNPHFNTLPDCMLTLVTMALGVTDLESILATHSPLGSLFFIIFCMIFIFVIVNMFLAVVMTTFTELRRRNQMFILAKASLLAKEAKDMQTRWINFLFCRRPQGTSLELAKKYAALKEDVTLDATDRERQMMDLRSTIMQQQAPSLKETLKYNMSQLDVFQRIMVVSDRKLKTRQQYIDELITEINLIEEQSKKRRAEQLRLESNKSYIYEMIKDMVLYTCFIVLFVTMVYYKASVEEKFILEESVRRTVIDMEFLSPKGLTMKFEDVTIPSSAYAWIEQVFPAILFKYSAAMDGKIIGDLTIRMTYIRADTEENPYSGTKDIFPLLRQLDSPTQKPLDEFTTPEYKERIPSKFNSYFSYAYNATRSFRGRGGYAYYLGSDYRGAYQLLQAVRIDNLLGNFSKALVFDFALYSGNTQLVLLCAIGLMKTSAGGIVTQVLTRSFECAIYTSQTIFRPALEIIFILFFLYYFYRVFREWFISFREVRDEWRSSLAEKKLLKEVMSEVQGIHSEQRTSSEECLHVMKEVVEFCWDGVMMVVMSLLRFVKKEVFNVLDVIFVALSIAMIVYMGKLLFSDFRRSFELPKDMGKENLEDLWTLSDYDIMYRTISAINCLIIFLRMLKNFRFSKRLSILTEVLGSAALDIVFFMAMFAMILAAFALMGFVLLGHRTSEYSTLDSAFLNIYFLLLKDISAYEFLRQDSKLGGLLLIMFLLLYNLFLMNMFIAIIVAHFDHIMDINKNAEHVGLLTTLKMTLVEYMNKLGAGRVKTCLERCLKRKENREETMSEPHSEQEEASIGDKSDEESLITENFVPITSSSKWILALEQKLLENSRQTLSFVKLKNKVPVDSRNSLLTLKPDVASIAFLTKELWLSEKSIKKKVYLWRQLTQVHEIAQTREQELEIVGREGRNSKQPLSPLQQAMWQASTMDLKLKLWTDSVGFNSQERACLWNSTLFSPALFSKKEEEWDLLEQLETEKNIAELDLTAEIAKVKPELSAFLSAFGECQRRYETFYRKGSRSSLSESHSDLLAYYSDTNDERMLLWLALSDQDRAMLFLNNTEKVEASILCHLLFECVNHHIIRLEIVEATMSDLLDAKIYDKHVRLAAWQAEHAILNREQEKWGAAKTDAELLSNYKFFLEKKKQAKVNTLKEKSAVLNELIEDEKRAKKAD